ncbi:MAG: hypothetical protein PHR30_16525 [Gallionellaceae bacterium]|nr:hypothetical protein [Gallionellaceae bacterium]
MSFVKWSTASSLSTAIAHNAGSTGNLDSLGATAAVFGDSWHNESSDARYQYATWFLQMSLASPSSAAPYARLWLLKSIDGTTNNYESGSTAGLPQRPADVIFPMLLTSGQQACAVGPTMFPSGIAKPLLQNQAGYAFSSSGTLALTFYAYRDEIV